MNLSDTAKQILGGVAPIIGTALLGPFGGLAGSFLANKLGTPTGDDKALEAKITSGDPAMMKQLVEAEEAFKEHMADIGLSEDKLNVEDRENARAREGLVRDLVPARLAYLVTIGFFGVLGYMLAVGKPKEGGDALLVMLGSLGSAWVSIIAYYFGSSRGSSAKDSTIASLMKR